MTVRHRNLWIMIFFVAVAGLVSSALFWGEDYSARPNLNESKTPRQMPHFERAGIVAEVIDGDTLKINGERIRLVGVDAPEIGSGPAAIEAKNFLAQICLGKRVLLDVDDLSPKDRYGRVLAVAYVELNDCWVNINQKLLKEGHAKIFYNPPSEFNPNSWIK
jgi:endonuclease YncB( thermonuclease family)